MHGFIYKLQLNFILLLTFSLLFNTTMNSKNYCTDFLMLPMLTVWCSPFRKKIVPYLNHISCNRIKLSLFSCMSTVMVLPSPYDPDPSGTFTFKPMGSCGCCHHKFVSVSFSTIAIYSWYIPSPALS